MGGKKNNFDDRFGDLNLDNANGPAAKMSVRNRKTAKKANGQAIRNEGQEDEYDNEDYGEETYGDENDRLEIDSILFMSQQPHEVFDNIMHPEYRELLEFLQRDEEYNWVYINPTIKKQNRSKSLDLAKYYE
jgi:hypothetical protein